MGTGDIPREQKGPRTLLAARGGAQEEGSPQAWKEQEMAFKAHSKHGEAACLSLGH